MDNDIVMRRGLKCILNLLLSAAIYVAVVICFLTVYNSNTVVILTPYKRTEQPHHCTLSTCHINDIQTTPSDGLTNNRDTINDIQTTPSDVLTNNRNTINDIQTTPTLAILNVQPHDTETAGYLNYDVWRQMPGYLVDDMRVRSSFPNHPDVRQITGSLKIDFLETAGDSHHSGKYAHKIYGFLKPLATGAHTFGFDISKRTALYGLELWLSNSTNPLHTRRILTTEVANQVAPPPSGVKQRRRKWKKEKEPTTPPPLPSQPPSQSANEFITSEAVWLTAGLSYYMEFLEKAFDGSITVELKWKVPNASNFVSISNDSFVPAVQLSDTDKFVQSPMATILQGPLPSNKLQSHWRVGFVEDTVYPVTDLDVLPPCNFSALYAFPRALGEYGVHNEIFVSGMYPDSAAMHWPTLHDKLRHYAIKQEVVDNVLGLYKAALNRSTKYKGTVEQLHYMEQTVNKENGSRFLVEFGVHLHGQDTTVHTSEYVYLPQGSNQLCHTVNFVWKQYVNVYLVVTLKSLGLWTKHLIRNVQHNQRVAQDFSVELVIVDYESSDLNVEEELSKSSLPKWHYIRKTGPFSRAGGLQAGLDYVTDPNSIVLTLDMHLVIPPGFVNYARKHVIQGKMAFSPMFFRLGKGYTEVNPQGFWEPYSYGIFGMYKSDWDNIGGYNTTHYTYEWGGEDVDVADRTMENGYEIFRIRYPGFLHYYHSRKGLWNS